VDGEDTEGELGSGRDCAEMVWRTVLGRDERKVLEDAERLGRDGTDSVSLALGGFFPGDEKLFPGTNRSGIVLQILAYAPNEHGETKQRR